MEHFLIILRMLSKVLLEWIKSISFNLQSKDTFENIVLENINLKVNKEAFEISEGADIHIENMKVNGKEYSLE